MKFPKKRLTAPKLTTKDFYSNRNRILVIRSCNGLGDILMHRMMFEDFKKVMPDAHIVFACPAKFHDAAMRHPFIDEVLDSATVDVSDYVISYNTSACCLRYELGHGLELDKHRADIWAEHCGVKLTKHNMHVPFLTEEEIAWGRQIEKHKEYKEQPSVLFSAYGTDIVRCLLDKQVQDVVGYLKGKGFFVYSTHLHPAPVFEKLGVPVFKGSILQWMSYIHYADYVVSIDTSTFHYAGGIKKPLTGIFTYIDGYYRGTYFDYILVQKHKKKDNWPCGPCNNWMCCTHPKCEDPAAWAPKPCCTELSSSEIIEGIEKMLAKWPLKS